MTRKHRVSVAFAMATLLSACGASASSVSEGAKAYGAKTLPLAGGMLPALPTGSVFIQVIEFHQAAGTSFPSQKHVPGLIYQAEGSQLLAIENGQTVNIGPAEGLFLGPLKHVHRNPGLSANHWYFTALWSTDAKSTPLVSLSARVAYATPDFPSSAFPPGPYIDTLRLLLLEPGGRTGAARYGGIEVLFVLEGSISLHTAGKSSMTLAAGTGAYESPGTATRVFNEAIGRSTVLAFYVTRANQPFETPVVQSP